jgi:hypothetical protein
MPFAEARLDCPDRLEVDSFTFDIDERMLASARMMDGKLILETKVPDLTAPTVMPFRCNTLAYGAERSRLPDTLKMTGKICSDERRPRTGISFGAAPLENISAAADGTGAQGKDCYKYNGT